MRRREPHFLVEAQSLLEVAAGPSLARIREDCDAAPTRLRPLLEYLEDHLFDKRLNVNYLKQACEVRDNSIALLFHSQVGQSPKAYITELRLETAARLLRDSDLRIWQIGELVGYSGLAVFGKAFARWAGVRPVAYRLRTREPTSGEEDPLAGEVDERYLRMAVAGTLPRGKALALIRRLLEIYPPENATRED